MLSRAIEGNRREAKLAIYVSLRELEVPPAQIDAEVLRAYISRVSNPGRSRSLTEYFSQQFDEDVAAGRIILLLDSFDEIPAVAGAVSGNTNTIVPYQSAIAALMEGSTSKCVVASREYRGPRTQAWPRFLLVGLSFDEQSTILRTYGVDDYLLELVQPLLRDPRQGFAADLRAALNLKLLADYLNNRRSRPDRPSQIFEQYVTSQLENLGVDPLTAALVVDALERLAFQLTRSPKQSHAEVVAQLTAGPTESLSSARFESALEQARACKLLVRVATRDETKFAFSHRRLQEYFATRYVLQHPSDVPPRALAEDGNWRETAVALLQEAAPRDAEQLVDEISSLIAEDASLLESVSEKQEVWSPISFHVFELLVAAFYASPDRIPEQLRQQVNVRLTKAWADGTIGDRKFVLDCLPLAPTGMQVDFVSRAFSGPSMWLRTAALRESARLHRISSELQNCIVRLLLTFMAHRRLSPDAKSVDADLGQLHDNARDPLRRLHHVLVWIPRVALLLCIMRVLAYLSFNASDLTNLYVYRFEVIYWVLIPTMVLWTYISSEPLAYGVHKGRLRLNIERLLRMLNFELPNGSKDILNVVVFGGTFLGLLWVILGVVEIGEGNFRLGIGEVVVLPVLSLYAFAWAPSTIAILTSVSSGARRPVRLYAIGAPLILLREKSRNRVVANLGLLLRSLAYMVLTWVPLFGVIFLVVHFGGRIGKDALGVLGIVFACAVPLVILVMVVRMWRSKRRVRRAVRDAGRPTTMAFLNSFLAFQDSEELAEFVRHIRVLQSEGSVTIGREPIRELSQLLESRRGVSADDSTQYCIELRELIQSGRLTSEALRGVDPQVLDELSKLEEVLRLNR
jgi:hypothetical protein